MLDYRKLSGDHKGAAYAAQKAAELISIKEIGLILGDYNQRILDGMRKRLNEEAEKKPLFSLAVAYDSL